MDVQTIEGLKSMRDRFAQEVTNICKNLEALSTDGAGVLYDIKQTVGADTYLGGVISQVGGACVNARANAISSLDQLTDIMDQKIAEAEAYNEETGSEYNRAMSGISGISFEK